MHNCYVKKGYDLGNISSDWHTDTQIINKTFTVCGFIKEGILKNSRIDCVSQKSADSVIFSCCDMDQLPDLNMTWRHEPS